MGTTCTMSPLKMDIIILATLVSIVRGDKQCSGGSYIREMDHILTCGIMKTVTANVMDCSKLCANTKKCFSTNTYKTDNGAEMCDLIKGSKQSLKDCFIRQEGSVYNEIASTLNCVAPQQCSLNPIRKALPDGWYQFGLSAFKHFQENKTWSEASEECSANKGTLASFDNEVEKQFVYHLIEESNGTVVDPETKINALKPFKHWRLDSTDTDVKLYGQASYQVDGLIKVLDIPGTAGSYATTPKFDEVSKMSFTISMWVKMPDSAELPYSSWDGNHVFTLSASFFSARKVTYQAHPHFTIQVSSASSDTKWMHVAGVWNRATKTAQLFHDGVLMGSGTSSETPDRLSFPNSPNPVFDIGMQRDPLTYKKGRVRNLVVFTRSFTADEVKGLKDATDMEPTRSLWIGSPPAAAIIPFPNDLNSGCVAMASKGDSYDWLKVSCDLKMEFICKKAV